MKKGISLIVLVITIIVMTIIAGAIIISLSGTNVVNRANEAVTKSDIANLKSALTLEYAEIMALNNDYEVVDGVSVLKTSNDVYATASDAPNGVTNPDTATDRYAAILDKFPALKAANYTVSTNDDLTFTVNEP